MIRKLALMGLVFAAPSVVACLNVTPIPPSPAFEAMLAASDVDGGEGGSPNADSSTDGGSSDAGGE
jgi:hypothetical protein